MALAALRIAQDDPHAATLALAPVLSGAAPVPPTTWLAHACLLEAIARDALGDPAAARDAMRRALDIATPDGALMAFLFHPPARELFDRYAPDRGDQAALVAEIRSLLPAEAKAGGAWGLAPASRLLPPGRPAEQERDPGAALPADQLVRAGDRPRAVPVSAHGPDAYTSPLRQARRARSHRGGRRAPAPSACSLHPAARPEVLASGGPGHRPER